MSSVPPVRDSYTKAWLSVPDQVAKLQARGLQIPDLVDAESFLYHVNYYSFAGYCLAFENPRHAFPVGVTFEQIKLAYMFDMTLRDLLNEALELIEIDLCTAVAYSFGQSYGPFGHVDPTNFHRKFDFKITHTDWLKKLHEETKRSSEPFIQHFRYKYLEYPDLPVWTVTEVMSFGGLSRMVAAMHKADRDKIATEYGVPARVLSSITHHFAYVRNLCAHHSRLWDRVWSIKSDLPHHPVWQNANFVSNQRLFSTLLLMRKMMFRSSQINSLADQWRDRVTTLLLAPPAVASPSTLMGLPINWQQHPVWL